MNWSLLLITLIPLVVFVIIDIKGSMRTAVIAAVLTSLAMLVWSYFLFGAWDEIGIAEVVLFATLGFVSVKLNSSRFFKFQPVVVGVGFALFIAYMQIFSEPVFIHMLPMLKAMRPDMAEQFDSPPFRAMMARVSLYLIPTFLLHAAALAYAALKCSNAVWIMTRLAIYPLAFGATLLAAVAQGQSNISP